MRMNEIVRTLPLVVLSLALAGGARAANLDRQEQDCRKAMEMTVYAQINRGILYAGNGSADELFFVDNDNSSTRFGWKGQGNINCQTSIGAKIELQAESNSTGSIDFHQSGSKGTSLSERHLDVWIANTRAGKLSIGQGDTASNGTVEVDLSGTTVIAYAGVGDLMGGLEFSNADTGVTTTVEIKDVINQYDGNSRQDRVRYDTPKLAGFTASTSLDDDNLWDMALRYANEFGGVRFAAAAHYLDGKEKAGFKNQYGVSASVLFPVGLSITAAYSGRAFFGRAANGADGKYYYLKGAFRTFPFEELGLGTTVFGVDYSRSDDHAAIDDRAETYGLFAVQNLIRGAQFYVGVRNHALNRPGAKFNDAWGVLTGFRIKM